MSEPTENGWYAYSGGAQTMIFHLRDGLEGKQWSAHFDNGDSGDCVWGYIEQALGVWDLVPLVPDEREKIARAIEAVPPLREPTAPILREERRLALQLAARIARNGGRDE